MNIKVVNQGKDISRVIINDPKTYNSLSTKNLTDLIRVFKKLDYDRKDYTLDRISRVPKVLLSPVRMTFSFL